ncbi:Stress response protein nst1 [Ceratocystis fimbriata CBS 114723]|uniref:Stress response protein NST1 n=1 Tax=Ceratocystis fimbriata CBS 114723 TaxID=1035309 RepID=A0A2C5X3T4_9PEZI|nr:Stress response protein nst1 [Ceratocystis fimbriata CBS 114723]
MPASKTCLPAQNLSSMRNTARYTNKDGTKVITVPRSLSSTTSSVVPTDQSSALPSSSATIAATTVPSPSPSPSTLSATVSHTGVSAPPLPESDPVMSNISTKKAKKRQRQAAAKAAAANGNNTSSSAAVESTFALGSSAEAEFLTATASGSRAFHTEKGTLPSNAAQNLDNHSQDRLVASQLIASSDHPIASATTTSSSQSKKNKKRKKKAKKDSPAPDNSAVESQYYQTRNSSVSDSHPYQQANHHHQQASSHPHHNPLARDDRVWDTKPHEDRERIKEFWLSLEEEERKSLVRLEKETVLKKMKDQQKNTCACNVCGRKRTAIERELEGLYDSYYRELEQYAQEGNATPFLTASTPNDLPIRRPPMPGAFPRTPGSQSRIIEHVNGEEFDEDEDDLDDDAEDDDAYSDEEYEEEYDDDTSLDARAPPPRQQDDLMAFGNSLQVKEGILTVADDLLRNDGKRFIEMMEKLAERRMAREDSNYTSGHIPGEPRHTSNVPSVNPNVVLPLGADHDHAYEDATEPYDDEGDEGDDGDNYDDEDAEVDEEDEEELDDPRSEEQRMAEGRKMFQIFAARMFEQRVLTAYRKKLSAERSARLMEELDAEERERQEREAAKSAKQQRKREKERAKKQAAAEAKAQREAEKAAEEAAKKAEKEAQAVKARAKAEEKKRAKEAQRRAEEEERQRKEAERLHRLHEQERKNKEAKERQNKLREEQKQKEKEAREAKGRELREKQEQKEQKEQKEREEKEKQEVLARERKAAAASAEQAKQALVAPASTAALPPSATAPVAASTIIPASSALPVTPSKPKATLSGITPGKTPMAAVSRAPSVLGTPAAPPTSTRKVSITSGLHNVLPMHNSNPGTTYVSPKIPAVTPIMAAKVPTPIRSRAPSQQMADNSSSSAPSGSQASGAPSQNASPLIGSSIHTSPSPLSSMAPHAPNLPPAVNNHFYNNQPLSPTNLGGLKAMLPTHTEQFMSRPSTVGAPPPGLPAPSMPPGLYNGRPVPDGMYSRFGSVDGISAPPGLGVPPMKTFPAPPAGLNNMPFDAFGGMSIGNFNFGMSTDSNQPPSSGHGRQASASFDLSALGITNNKNGSNSMSKPAPIGRPGSVVHASRSNSMPHDDVNEHLGSRALLDDAQDDILGPSPAPRQRVVSGAPGPIRPAVFSASPFIDTSNTFSLGGYSQWGPTTTPSSGFAPPAGIWNNPTTPSSATMPFPSSAGVSGASSHPWRKAVAPPTLRRYLAQACQTFREAGQLVHPDGYADYGKIKMHIETQLHTEIDDRDLMDVTETLGNIHNGNGTFECRELGGGVRVIRWDPPVDPFLGSLQKPAVSRDSVDHVIGHGIGRV